MSPEERIKLEKEKAKESSKELFKEKQKDVKEEFEKETVMGNPKNLVRPESKEE